MNVEKAFETVLDTGIISGPAVFILLDDSQKQLTVKVQGAVAEELKAAVLESGSFELFQEAVRGAGGSFKMIPLSGLDKDGYVGAAFTEKDIPLDLMAEKLYELLGMLKLTVREGEEVNRYHLLYQITKKIHSSMDVHGVLREILLALNESYPSYDCRLLLSHDNGEDSDLPIEHLGYGPKATDESASKAYLTGDIQFSCTMEKKFILYAPLKGKQGTYGVLQVTTPGTEKISEADAELIELLAGTGGNALENARLYQQSQRFISDLKLINQTSHQLNANLRLTDTIHFMADQITRSFKANEVGFILFRSNGENEVLEGSTLYFQEEQSQPLVQFVSERLKVECDPLFIGDLAGEPLEIPLSYRSFMGVPMIQNSKLRGMLIVLHHSPYHFSFDEFKLLQSLVHHSTLAFSNSILHERLQRMVITDYLTGLYARHYLDEQIEMSMKRDEFGCFILLDIDDFKVINDTYGHQVGDEVLVQVAGIIRENTREMDVAARWGGEELAIYLPKVGRELGLKIGKRLVNKISEGTNPKTTVSCGLSHWGGETHGNSLRALFFRADRALYCAKGAGKNQVIVQDEEQARGALS